MIATIARKEFTEMLRDGRFKWTAVIMVLLLLTSLLTGWQRYTAFTDTRDQAQGSTNEQWLKQGDKNPHSAAHFGNYAFKPAGPLSFFDSGIENYTGNAVFMEAHRQNFSFGRSAADASAITRFGDLTGAMVLQVLLPLFIIFMAFSAFSGEAESGTLRQLLSMGVNKRNLLWGKALGISAAIGLVVVPCLAIGAFVLGLTSVDVAAQGFGARVAIMALTYTAYAAIFLFLTLAVSALTHTARTTLIIMVGFWAFTAFLAPKAVAEMSKAYYQTYSYGEFQSALRTRQAEGFDGTPPKAVVRQRMVEMFKEYKVSKIADLPVYWPAFSMQTLEELDHKVFDYYYGNIRDNYASQRRFQNMFGIIAPTLALRSLSMALAGTDLIHHVKFMGDAETHRRTMVNEMNSYLMKAAVSLNASYSSSNFMVADEVVFARIKPFEYQPPKLGQTLAEHRNNFLLLGFWIFVAVGFSVFSVNRLGVETNHA